MNSHVVTFDKLLYLDRLKLAGVTEEVARAHADGLEQAFRETVATKSDLEKTEAALRNDLEKTEAALRNDLEKTEAALRGEITGLRGDLEKTEISLRGELDKLDAKIDITAATIRREIEASKNGLLMWLIPFLLTGILPSLYTALKTAGILH